MNPETATATVLFDPGRHEALIEKSWDADVARGAIERIVADTRAAFTPRGLWPAHPNDAENGERAFTMLYMGAAGVIWALDHLAREGAAASGHEFRQHLSEIQVLNHEALETAALETRSFLIGDAGILFAEWKLNPSDGLLASLAQVIADNTDDPARELMWGAPGTMLAALGLHQATGEERWADLFRAGAAALEEAFVLEEALGARLWEQELYGQRARYLGAVHGFAGNAAVLIKGRELLAPEAWRQWSSAIARTLEATAVRGPAGVNWPPGTDAAMKTTLLAQHCHGAPGMVTCLAALDEPIDELLIGGGDLTWAAGPLAKGSNVCHGTAGNGMAFLKLFERTGDQMWLERARTFAMHAIAQSDAEAASFGQRRYSLWTGDLGLACYLWECIGAMARFPTVDSL